MAISNFIAKLWAAAVQLPFQQNLVFGQPTVVNRKYEGDLKKMGDTVNVTSITKPTIGTYTKGTDLTIQELSDTTGQLVVNQGQYYAFHVQDIDEIQAAGDFESAGLWEAGIGLRDAMDKYIASQYYANALSANKYGRAVVVNGGTNVAGAGQTLAYNILVSLREKLDTQSVPLEGRYVVVPPAFMSGLLLDNRFIRVNESGTDQGLRNGLVGRVSGLDVLISNNLRTVNQSNGSTGADQNDLVLCAGVPDAVSCAQQLVETEAIRDPKQFADIVRGVNIYGAQVFRPEGIATATVTFAAGTG